MIIIKHINKGGENMDKLSKKFGRVAFVETFHEAEKLSANWIRERNRLKDKRSFKVQIMHNPAAALGKWKVQETQTFDEVGSVQYVR